MKYLVMLSILLASSPALAEEKCAALIPTNAQDVKETFKGEIEGDIKGILSKIAGGSANISGEYEKLSSDKLKDYPDSHKVYVWQRIIYLACVSPEIKIDINKLFELYLAVPVEKKNSQVPVDLLRRVTLDEVSLEYVRSILGVPRSEEEYPEDYNKKDSPIFIASSFLTGGNRYLTRTKKENKLVNEICIWPDENTLPSERDHIQIDGDFNTGFLQGDVIVPTFNSKARLGISTLIEFLNDEGGECGSSYELNGGPMVNSDYELSCHAMSSVHANNWHDVKLDLELNPEIDLTDRLENLILLSDTYSYQIKVEQIRNANKNMSEDELSKKLEEYELYDTENLPAEVVSQMESRYNLTGGLKAKLGRTEELIKSKMMPLVVKGICIKHGV